MARINIPELEKRIQEPLEIAEFLAQFDIQYENWPVRGRIGEDASDEDILEAYEPEIERLKKRGGYVTADVINVNPETPELEDMLNLFNKEHRHTDDEVRFIVEGRGIFHIHPDPHPVFAIQVESGDLINVPAGTRHWFDLCEENRIRAIRLFMDTSGWTPRYVDKGVHAGYVPMCWGPAYIPANRSAERN